MAALDALLIELKAQGNHDLDIDMEDTTTQHSPLQDCDHSISYEEVNSSDMADQKAREKLVGDAKKEKLLNEFKNQIKVGIFLDLYIHSLLHITA